MLGDSFLQGFSVNQGYDMASVLRGHGYDVFNLGCASNGPLTQLAGYVECGRAFDPDVVIWFYFEGNDLLDLEREQRLVLADYLDEDFS